MSNKKYWIANFSLLFASVIAALLMGEWYIRHFHRQLVQELIGPLYIEDPVTLFRIRPLLSTRHRFAGYDVVYHTNSLGLRTREIDSAFPANRIICLGDSFTFGMGVKDDETYPYNLETYLKNALPNENIGVINAGQIGWGTGQELRWLESSGLNLKPMGVVLQFCYNDYMDDQGKKSIDS